MHCDTVAFFIFNRPDTTRLVFERIAAARPRRLLVVADAARAGRAGEDELCRQTRAVVERIDWPCDVERDYALENMGCRRRLASGLDWVFGQVDDAIILEDDCLPHPTFFRYCSDLLDRYRDDSRVMAISGDSFQPESRAATGSYYFSRYFHCWGWATWGRAWATYDVGMSDWPQLARTRWLATRLHDDRGAMQFWEKTFTDVHEGRVDTWDCQFLYACWKAGGLTILPSRNLVSNIGFRADATHTAASGSKWAALPVEAMQFPLVHRDVEQDRRADEWSQHYLFEGRRRPSFMRSMSRWWRPREPVTRRSA